MKKERRKKTMRVLAFIVALVIIQTLPIFFLKPMGYETIADENIQMYYSPGEQKGAEEVFELLQLKSDEIKEKMKMEINEPIQVYIYKTQNQLALREAGFITLTFAPSWHIGDSHNGNIMMVSPYTKVKGHTYESILNATLHELVHAINYQINPKISYFWDNGLATYLANQKPNASDLTSHSIPTFKQMQTNNGLEFGNMGGYAYSYSYIEYLDETYGWDKVLEFASGGKSYEDVFGKSELEVYNDWCNFCRSSSF
ncbi:MAG: hypothetical protein KMY55_01255 [Dethiosulfatibacter sp.]|nr:hypothetical protein [Dethiosulfatibacter sp.]